MGRHRPSRMSGLCHALPVLPPAHTVMLRVVVLRLQSFRHVRGCAGSRTSQRLAGGAADARREAENQATTTTSATSKAAQDAQPDYWASNPARRSGVTRLGAGRTREKKSQPPAVKSLHGQQLWRREPVTRLAWGCAPMVVKGKCYAPMCSRAPPRTADRRPPRAGSKRCKRWTEPT